MMRRALTCALFRRRLVWAMAVVLGLGFGLLLADAVFPPPIPGQGAGEGGFAQVVLARDGSPLRAFPDKRHVWRYPISPRQVSPLYVQALLTYEDRAFYWHPGINPWALLRAAWQWGKEGRVISGGSTLTMQVARLFEPQPRTVLGKLRQGLRAVQLEWRYSKEEILALYLNYAPMGGVIEGVEAASRAYLGKAATRLSHAEAALLSVLPQAPSRLRPDRFPQLSRAARDKLLGRMVPQWGEATVREAMREPAQTQTLREPLLAPLLAERLRQEQPGEQRLQTFINPQAQSTLELLLLDRVAQLPPRVSIAALVMDNRHAEVLAYAGCADFSDPARFAHVDMVRAQRSPGSTLKPFLYGLALDEGLIHSESLLSDVPRDFSGYQPGNFQESFNGPVSVSEALVRSLNVPAVEVLDQLGPARFHTLLRRGGLNLRLPRGAEPNLSIILGGASVNLENLVGAYTALARQGVAARPRFSPGQELEEQRMLSPGAAFIIRDLLESGGPMGRALVSGAGMRQGIAWKTGTSFGFRDAWALGVSDHVTIGVWVGRPDGAPNPGFFGANIAAPLLVDLFAALDPSPPGPRQPPSSVRSALICWPLGLRPKGLDDASCHERRSAWLLNDIAPPTFADPLRLGSPRYSYFTDALGRQRLHSACSPAGTLLRRVETAYWPILLEPWLNAGLQRNKLPPPWAVGCAPRQAASSKLRITGLRDGAVLHRSAQGASPVAQIEARGGSGELIWLVDGVQVARLPASNSLRQHFDEPGRHDITVLDAQGAYDRISVLLR